MYSMTKKELIDWLVIQQTSSYSVVQSLVATTAVRLCCMGPDALSAAVWPPAPLPPSGYAIQRVGVARTIDWRSCEFSPSP